MAKTKTSANKSEKGLAGGTTPRSLEIFTKGIKTDKDFAAGMSALMGDLIEGSITPAVGNAVCKAGANMLNVIALKYKYGTDGSRSARREKTLSLTS